MDNKPDCYGKMFPDMIRLKSNASKKGKAFSVLANSCGIGFQSKQVDVDLDEWEACQKCPYYQSCYDLSMAKNALTETLHQMT